MRDTVAAAADWARSGGGPTIIEALTYRHFGHSRTDPPPTARRGLKSWLERDPLDLARARLDELGVAKEQIVAADDRAERLVADAVAAAKAAPAADPADAFTDVWADGGASWRTSPIPTITYREAVAEGIAREMRRATRSSPRRGTSAPPKACSRRRSACSRVRTAARVGHPDLRAGDRRRGHGCGDDRAAPVAEIMFSDFLACCWDYLANEIPKVPYMTGGQVTVPLVVRTANGGGLSFGAQHSQATENWAFTIPGLKIAAPSTPADVIGLMASAIC